MGASAGTVYESLQAFYLDDPRRVHSPEADYGVWWLEGRENWPRWRVAYVRDTGEVYAVKGDVHQRVEVLGILPPDPVLEGQVYYRTLDRLLEGWADRCGQPNGLAWLRERLKTPSAPQNTQALAWAADADYSRRP